MKKSYFPLILIAGALIFAFSGCIGEQQNMQGWPGPKPEPIKHHTVQKGDSISLIAEQYGVLPQQLAASNGLGLKGSESTIYPGQKLVIPIK